LTGVQTVVRDGVTLLETAGNGWRACFSTRLGGVSQGDYAELNVSFAVGDDAGHALENRRRLGRAAGFDAAALVAARQVHGVRVAAVSAAARGSGARGPGDALADTDGLMTDSAGLPLMISTADCVPVVIAATGPNGPVVAVVHAGWRGMLDDILVRAALQLRRRGNLTAAVIGPSIGPCCFDVADEVGGAFEERYPGTWRGGRVDLWTVAARQLTAAGLAVRQITNPHLCTVCDRRFFSHRRDRGRTGRQAAVAWIVPRDAGATRTA
jgi:YfiH family protein